MGETAIVLILKDLRSTRQGEAARTLKVDALGLRG
jgi:hypothetical protein